MADRISIIIVNEEIVYRLLPVLEAYGVYMYESLQLTAGKEKFTRELANFPLEKYSSPNGCFLLAFYNDEVAGCIGLSKHTEESCELKRMYTVPQYRGKGIAHKMVSDAIAIAKQLDYKNILLDTNKEMAEAVALYKKMGFEEIEPWCENENPNPVWLRYSL